MACGKNSQYTLDDNPYCKKHFKKAEEAELEEPELEEPELEEPELEEPELDEPELEEPEQEVSTCMFILTRGERKGEACGKNSQYTLDDNPTVRSISRRLKRPRLKRPRLKRPRLQEAKVEEVKVETTAEEDFEDFESIETVQSDDDISKNKNCCLWVLTRGKNKGTNCGKPCDDDSDMCRKHTKLTSSEDFEKKIENYDSSDSDGAIMDSQTIYKEYFGGSYLQALRHSFRFYQGKVRAESYRNTNRR